MRRLTSLDLLRSDADIDGDPALHARASVSTTRREAQHGAAEARPAGGRSLSQLLRGAASLGGLLQARGFPGAHMRRRAHLRMSMRDRRWE